MTEATLETLFGLVTDVTVGLRHVEDSLCSLRHRVTDMKNEVHSLRSDLTDLKNEVKHLRTNLFIQP